MDKQLIGKFIKELIQESNLSNDKISEKLGVSNKIILNWETGLSLPSAQQMEILCKELKISIVELLSGKRLDDNEYHNQAEYYTKLLLEYNKKFFVKRRIISFFEGAGTGILLSAVYSPDTTRKVIIIMVGVVMICLGWLIRFIMSR